MEELQAGVELTLAIPPKPSVLLQPSETALDGKRPAITLCE